MSRRSMAQLACPLCDDEGPWENAAARAAHIRAHHTADCEVCGQSVNASGLEAHMRYVHGDSWLEVAEPTPEPEQVDDVEPDSEPERAGLLQPSGHFAGIPSTMHPEPKQVDEPAPADLTCPDCGGGPYADRRGLAGHRRSHQEVTCDECGKKVKANGLGPHMRGHRPTQVKCPDCGKLLSPAGLGAHRAAHRRADEPATPAPAPAPPPARPRFDPSAEVECPDCGILIRQRGLAAHRAAHRRSAERAAAAAADAPPTGTLPEVLAAMLPGAATDLVDRITEFLEQAKEPPAPGLWVVVPLNGGRPWLCRTAAVGPVAAREHTAALVVSVDDIAAELNRPAPGDTSAFHAGQSWPHPKAKAS